MKYFLLFAGNFILALIFGWDLMDFYSFNTVNIISNEVNRIFISYFGLIVSSATSVYFAMKFVNITKP